MRILHVSSARALGGGERHLADLARGLAGRGHEIFAALRPSSPLRGKLETIAPGRIIELPLRNALDIPSSLRLSRFARENDIEIIHAHVARDYPLAALAARRAPPVRLVITRHVLFPLSRLHRRALSNVSRVIAVSEGVARGLRAQQLFDAAKIRVVANGVDLPRWTAATRTPNGPWRVGIVGELSELKGQEDFLIAAAIVIRELDDAVEFIVVGEDASPSGRYRTRLEGIIADRGLSGRAHLVGRLEDEAMPALMGSLDLLVSASRSESFGMAMAEAMACGVPVVATATEGAREIVEDGTTGLLIPMEDSGALAAAILSLLRDSERRRKFAERAALVARERFSLDRMVDETERVYVEALEGLAGFADR